eukprot:CAMPEP_0197022842 /NCGR_PEP_ID=MMETSP1384-20130603/3646_1 /TAXON_ID=29189 /ORGANISM="Ammonia sp." /LENGTH=279 /DNA_ID=CAMNT_0042450953 /DNA_START=24 /DNA_END=863 /DNA_ORIENTATION=+
MAKLLPYALLATLLSAPLWGAQELRQSIKMIKGKSAFYAAPVNVCWTSKLGEYERSFQFVCEENAQKCAGQSSEECQHRRVRKIIYNGTECTDDARIDFDLLDCENGADPEMPCKCREKEYFSGAAVDDRLYESSYVIIRTSRGMWTDVNGTEVCEEDMSWNYYRSHVAVTNQCQEQIEWKDEEEPFKWWMVVCDEDSVAIRQYDNPDCFNGTDGNGTLVNEMIFHEGCYEWLGDNWYAQVSACTHPKFVRSGAIRNMDQHHLLSILAASLLMALYRVV